jgi:hypothetical protein
LLLVQRFYVARRNERDGRVLHRLSDGLRIAEVVLLSPA